MSRPMPRNGGRRLREWIAQAEGESDGRPWVVAFRANRTPWYAVQPLADYVEGLAPKKETARQMAKRGVPWAGIVAAFPSKPWAGDS